MAVQRSIYHLLLYKYELGRDSKTASENNNRGKAQGFVFRRKEFRFLTEFHFGNTNMKEQMRSGRPHELDGEDVSEAIKEDLTLLSRNWLTILTVITRQSAEY
ncbi:hypothetical protein KIN20_032143 [Parelaphostrongylus tenuis]|uniref:Uncharacterized protein n=1 Tax=Parelaphostrongylus tenuis TaxID=148309 RepID=A0AAD5R6I6_PARTN|nr:hypothetical protein KIN20_032143 [Parelaphostrongylus tenuis]